MTSLGRRRFLRSTLLAGTAACLAAYSRPSWAAAGSAVTLADVGVGDPGGDWSKFTDAAGWDVNLVAIGNAPSAILNVLIAGGGLGTYDIIHIVGGIQEPLVENDLILPIDTGRIPNWQNNAYIEQFFTPEDPGFGFIAYEGQVYAVPTILQGDSFAYLPDEAGQLDSYGALFDPKFRGYSALEDNYTTAGQKTALYLKQNNLASIKDPSNMTPEEIEAVVDFLIQKKKEGQFRVIWSSFEQAVNLLTRKEVYVIDCWEPMVFAARDQGVNAVYADPKEGYLLWAMAAHLVNNPNRSEEQTQAAYDLLNFLLSPWYGAKITQLRGYMTNSGAPEYALGHPTEFTPEQAQRVAEIDRGVKLKFEKGGTWQNRWPEHVEVYEEQWARFKAA